MGGYPGFNVKLAGRASAEVACGNIDDTVVQSQKLQHVLLPGNETLVLGLGFLLFITYPAVSEVVAAK